MEQNMDLDLTKLEAKGSGLPRSESAPFENPPAEIEQGPLYVNIEERMPDLAADDQAPAGKDSELPVDRRDFMRLFGTGAVMAATAGCIRRPVEKVIPYVNQPIDQTPGVAVDYATVTDAPLAYGIVVRTREGRPTKVEGNGEHPMSQGATSAYDQAALQALYHPERRKQPQSRQSGTPLNVEWDQAYKGVADAIAKTNKKVAILTGGSTGHVQDFYKEFLRAHGQSEDQLYTYDARSLYSEMAEAWEQAFGAPGLPRTDLRRTDYVVSIGGSFLDQGIAQVYETKSFTAGHSFRPGRMGQLIQFESRMTMTGTKATERHPIAPGDETGVALMLLEAILRSPDAKGSKEEQAEARKIVEEHGALIAKTRESLGYKESMFDDLATGLLANRSLVMVGNSESTAADGTALQLIGIAINVLIGAVGKNIYYDRGWFRRPVEPRGMARLMKDMSDIGVLIIVGTNPAFSMPASSGFQSALKKVPTVVSIQSLPNETDEYASWVLNSHHYLEAWGDCETVAGFWSMRQPVVRPFTGSRQAEDILLWVAATGGKAMPYADYRSFIRAKWRSVYELIGAKVDFDTFFKAVQRRGFVGKLQRRTLKPMAAISGLIKSSPKPGGLKLVAYIDNRLIAGEGAALPVLQEVGDPLTTVTWDTFVCIAPDTCRKIGVKYNQLVEVQGPAGTITASVYPMPGLHPDTVAIPRGNGHKAGVSLVTTGIGVDPLPVLGGEQEAATGYPVTGGQSVKIKPLNKWYRLAAMQKENDIGNRTDIVKKTGLNAATANARKTVDLDTVPDLYPDLPKGEYLWGMSVDLSRCTGCSACMVACAQENNVPQVGREQILLGREMHGLRQSHKASALLQPKTAPRLV